MSQSKLTSRLTEVRLVRSIDSKKVGMNEMRAIVCSALVTLLITTAGAQAQQCTPNHELYRIVPEHRAIMLDGGEIKRVMFVDEKDERLTSWKPGHNIT